MLYWVSQLRAAWARASALAWGGIGCEGHSGDRRYADLSSIILNFGARACMMSHAAR
jgi:hypothetical protein